MEHCLLRLKNPKNEIQASININEYYSIQKYSMNTKSISKMSPKLPNSNLGTLNSLVNNDQGVLINERQNLQQKSGLQETGFHIKTNHRAIRPNLLLSVN